MVPPGGGAERYPDRPIRLVVPFAPGGPGDMLGRLLAEKLSAAWGQPVSVECRHGANGITGSDIVAKAAPDGYTLAISASAHYINPSVYRTLPFDPVTSFTPVTLVASGPNVIVLNVDVPINSVAELIEYASAHPGELKYASGGFGSPSHLAGELFNMMAGVKLIHVPYKGHAAAGDALTQGKDAQLMFDAALTAMPHLKKKEWKAIAVTTPKRVQAFGDLPTISESGLSGYEVSPAMGVLAPANTPSAIVAKIAAEVARIVRMPDIVASLRADGAEPVGNTPEEYAAYVKSEIRKWQGVVKNAGIEPLPEPV